MDRLDCDRMVLAAIETVMACGDERPLCRSSTVPGAGDRVMPTAASETRGLDIPLHEKGQVGLVAGASHHVVAGTACVFQVAVVHGQMPVPGLVGGVYAIKVAGKVVEQSGGRPERCRRGLDLGGHGETSSLN